MSTTVWAMDDRQMVAAIAAGDPKGIAAAYDQYAVVLYGYCQSMLMDPANAAEALRDTFVVAVTAIGDLGVPGKLRPLLYAVARHECQHRLGVARPGQSGQDDAEGQLADAAERPGARGDLDPDELQSLTRNALAELSGREREAIELSLWYDLQDDDLAEALGVSRSRAQAMAARGRARLEKAVGAEGLRAAAHSGPPPLTPLPPGLRGQILTLCSATTPDAVAYRRQTARRTESVRAAGVARVTKPLRWTSIRTNPGAAIAVIVVLIWLVAAASVTLLTLAHSHHADAPTGQPGTGPSASSTGVAAAAATAPATISSASAAAKPFPGISLPPATSSAAAKSSPTFIESPSGSATPSRSPSPTGSPSSSPSQ